MARGSAEKTGNMIWAISAGDNSEDVDVMVTTYRDQTGDSIVVALSREGAEELKNQIDKALMTREYQRNLRGNS